MQKPWRTNAGNYWQTVIAEDDKVKLRSLLDEYLTALVYWLRKISFLAKYRLVSVKEINLNYRLGTVKEICPQSGRIAWKLQARR